MGFSSNNCNHCKHPMLDSRATDKGINEWMSNVVFMDENDTRLVGEFDGEGHRIGNYELDGTPAVFAHFACWEIAGKPDYDSYEGDSTHAGDQGWFFKDGAHDLIDPRITDEAERARLLTEGVARRTQMRFDQRARFIAEDWLDEEDQELPAVRWKMRFSYGGTYEQDEEGNPIRKDGKYIPVPNGWYYTDKLAECSQEFTGTEDELIAHLSAEWAKFLESNECKAYLARYEEIRLAARAKRLEELKVEGRYARTYRSRPAATRGKYHTLFYVDDKMSYGFVKDEDCFTGDMKEARAACDAEVQRLNEEWAAAGYPEGELL